MTTEEENVVRELYRAKRNYTTRYAYCTAARPITLKKWRQIHPVEENTDEVVVPEGTTLKIVMVSRFGDCGLTDDLAATNGYHVRVNFDGEYIRDIRWEA